jgi:alpha-beta hydrolase superfamily lysophospholipase
VADSFTFDASDGGQLIVYRWLPSGAPRAVVQVAHGAAEHAQRYGRMAERLAGAGYAVYADDHRGHGRTAGTLDRAGIVGPDAWNRMVHDEKELTEHLAATHPGVPIVLLGHSMGSLIAQDYLQRYGDGLAAAALSGSASSLPVGADDLADRVRAAIERDGRDAPSEDFGALFAGFNEPFLDAAPPGGPTGFEWLSRDDDEVARYVEDPWCGFPFSNGLVLDMAEGLERVWAPDADASVPRGLPLLVFSGDHDPVGDFGEGVRALAARYRLAGLDVTERLYPNARHELFNETNRDEVEGDLLAWLDQVLTSRR